MFIQKNKIGILGLLLTLTTITTFAQNTEAPPDSSTLSAHIETRQEYCPPVESLHQNKDTTWSAPNGWKSRSPSFVKSLRDFIGAQWVGVNVGEVICVYVKGGRNEFPVTLQRPYLVESPTGNSWTAETEGRKDCKTADVYQCPFNVRTTVRSKSIYEDLNFHKGEPVQDSN
jgi:hypothetical protein